MMITREQAELWLAVSKDKDQFAGLLPLYSRKYTDILHYVHFNYDKVVMLFLANNQDIKDAIGTLDQMNNELPEFMRDPMKYRRQTALEFINGSSVRGTCYVNGARGLTINYLAYSPNLPEKLKDEMFDCIIPMMVARKGHTIVEF